MRRRTLLGSGLAVSFCGFDFSVCMARPEPPRPRILDNEIWSRCRNVYTGEPVTQLLRTEFLRRVEFIPAHRTAATQRRELRAQYTMELAYDGRPPAPFYTELAEVMMSEVASELALIRPLHLVAFDSPGPSIDPATFQPYLGFYIDHNV